MTDENKKDNKDRKKLSDEELEDVAGGTYESKNKQVDAVLRMSTVKKGGKEVKGDFESDALA